MLKYILLCTLLWQSAWTVPVQPQGEVPASPILILTPQAQVHLDPIPGAYIHHLSPLARIAAPHEETIVYVPSGALPALLPVDGSNVGRSSAGAPFKPLDSESPKQFGNVSQQIEAIQAVIQSGASMYPQLSEAATAAAAAASAAASTGSGLFPTFFPPNREGAQPSALKPEPQAAAAAPLLPGDARHLYVLPSAPQHIVDLGNGPFLVTPITAIRARSIEKDEQIPIVAVPLPATNRPEALPQTADTAPEPLKEASASAPEQKSDFGRFLDAASPFLESNAKQEIKPLDNKRSEFAEPSLEASAAHGQLVPAARLPGKLKSQVAQVSAPEQEAPVPANEVPIQKS